MARRFPDEVETLVGAKCFICEKRIEDGDRGVITESTGQTGPPNQKTIFAHEECWRDWAPEQGAEQ